MLSRVRMSIPRREFSNCFGRLGADGNCTQSTCIPVASTPSATTIEEKAHDKKIAHVVLNRCRYFSFLFEYTGTAECARCVFTTRDTSECWCVRVHAYLLSPLQLRLCFPPLPPSWTLRGADRRHPRSFGNGSSSSSPARKAACAWVIHCHRHMV